MYRTILVPLDGSERAEKILPHVEALAGIKMGRLILLHAVEPTALTPPPLAGAGVPAPQTPGNYEDLIEQAKKRGEEYLAKIRSILKTKDIESETVVEIGPVVERIIRTAEERDVDLIALASHGRTGLARVFFGSVAAGVLHRSEHPLLLIRSREDEGAESGSPQ